MKHKFYTHELQLSYHQIRVIEGYHLKNTLSFVGIENKK